MDRLVHTFSSIELNKWSTIQPSGTLGVLFNTILLIAIVKIISSTLEISLKLIRWIFCIVYPMNYELDMTTNYYCKYIVEVDNELKKVRCLTRDNHLSASGGDSNEQEKNTGKQSVDCTTGLTMSNDQRTQSTLIEAHNENSAAVDVEQKSLGNEQYVYPNGWLPVMESSKVKPGTIERGIILGRDIIITRSIEGEVSILDAYCPHIGVHIGVGGRVVRVENQSCVQCPFHGWTFRATDGQCVRIPYLKSGSKGSLPKQAKLGVWTSTEVDNFIYIWHHIDNQPPNWFYEQTKELSSKKWVLAGRSCHKTNLDIRDMLENGADMNHFEGIHNDLFFFGGEFLKVQAYNFFQNYFRHHWSPEWKPILDEEDKVTHKAEMNLLSWISFFKTRIFDIQVRATQVGPACVSLRYDSQWYGKGVLKMNAIPLGGRRTMYVQHIYTEKTPLNWFMARWVLYGEIMQLERDFFIWNHKKNIKNPIFVQEDKILKRFRLWYSQFYKRKRQIVVHEDIQSADPEKNDLVHETCLSNKSKIDF